MPWSNEEEGESAGDRDVPQMSGRVWQCEMCGRCLWHHSLWQLSATMFNRNALFLCITCDPVYLKVKVAVYVMCQGPMKSLTHYNDTISLLESEYTFMCNEIFSPLVWNIKSFLLFSQLDICSPPIVLPDKLSGDKSLQVWTPWLLCDYTFCYKKNVKSSTWLL